MRELKTHQASGLNYEEAWLGCTTTLLSNFPYDGNAWDTWRASRLGQITAAFKSGDLPKNHIYTRSWIANLCSQQMEAKAMLEELGWRCLIETPSGHPETPNDKICNGGTCYIMWYEIPKEKK